VGFGCVFALLSATSARADISEANMYRTVQYTQTGDGSATTFDSAYFNLRLYSTLDNEYTTVLGFYPGPDSPVTLDPVPTDATRYDYDSGFFSSQAQMDIAFPKGAYSLTANNTTNGDAATTMFDYLADAYAQSQPYLTGTDYSDLQGMNPAIAFDFHFSPFIEDASATESGLFFTIFDVTTGDVVFGNMFLPVTTTGVTLPANTLMPNHDYVYDLVFSDRWRVTSNGADFPALLAFDTRADGGFTTGTIPEPAGLAMLGAVGVALLARGGRRTRTSAVKPNM
jgi:hypothetical protein